jgi:transposase
MQDTKRAARRRHDDELKQRVLAQCREPGASVAQVALAHGLNANLVHKWRRVGAPVQRLAAPTGEQLFVPVAVARDAAPETPPIRIELRRGALAVSVSWPLGAADHCAAWLRELLR